MARFSIIMLLAVLLWQPDGWKFEMDKNGVKVYTKKDPLNEVRSFKGVTNVSASPKEVIALIRDYDRYPEWVSGVSSASVFKKESDTSYYIHVHVKLPFPVSDRDIVQRIEISKLSNDAYRVQIITVPDELPEEKGFVRMTLSDGYWDIISANENRTESEVTMVSINDPGGSVPKWLVNMMSTDSPYKTLKKMREILRE